MGVRPTDLYDETTAAVGSDRHAMNDRSGPTGPERSGASAAGFDAAQFEALRAYLFAVAYRLLGSAADAEDVVQDAFLRVHDAPAEAIRAPKAYLATVVTRLCLDQLRSARATRESYIGPWLPEPVLTIDAAPAPAEVAEQADEISLAFLTLLERLTPEERAAFVLREAFAYPYDDIGTMLGKPAATARQLAHRARERVAAGRARFRANPDQQRALADRFLAASRSGDLGALTEVLAADVVSWSDGGPARRAARRPIRGRDAISRWIAGVLTSALSHLRPTFAEVNGGIACLLWDGDRLDSVTTFEVSEGRIARLWTVLNPDKLAHLQRRLVALGLAPDGPTGPGQGSVAR